MADLVLWALVDERCCLLDVTGDCDYAVYLSRGEAEAAIADLSDDDQFAGRLLRVARYVRG